MEEELWRSIQVYFVSFLAIGALNSTEYVRVGGIETFVLVFVAALIYFKLMVGYRKKEHLTNPSIGSIIGYVLQRQKPERRNTGYMELRPDFRPILAILVITYLVYRYAV